MKNGKCYSKHDVKLFKEQLKAEFTFQSNVSHTIHKLVLFIDEVLRHLFHNCHLHKKNNFCLLALGGYGRRELFLYSDIDILLLHAPDIDATELELAQKFIQSCWDFGLEISHQITTVSECTQLAADNISVISSIMDMHMICGLSALMEELSYRTHPLHMWSSQEFFTAKLKEQHQRDIKYGETAYNLEPNVKYGQGGLRDLQILLSIGKRHYHIKKLAEGLNFGFITEKEYELLMRCQHFLWHVRFALHCLADKAEERLSFDYQIKLAKFFAYQDQPHSLAIEQFMKDYFKVIKKNRELNEMLLLWFEESITNSSKHQIIRLDEEFQLCDQYLEVRHPRVFKNNPPSLLKLFLWLARRPDIDGIRADTIRLIRESLYLINSHFKKDARSTHLFFELFKNGHEPYHALQAMSRYGVLAHYMECFAQVTGQMQYDLFHVFTVDQHTLFVIRNISRFKQAPYSQHFPLAAQLMRSLAKPEILYLSALFHDIAKGRGGDHSELGALEAAHFAQTHKIVRADQNLLVWLVRHHLLMSQTAQRHDIYDPQTVDTFCQALPHPHYLDYLYLLTVADICGTNPSLWNAWKDSLLKELYRAAKRRLEQQVEKPDERKLIIAQKKSARQLLKNQPIDPKEIKRLWQQLRERYFLHESPEVIAQHTQAILTAKSFPLIIIMPHHTQGGTEIFIYMPHQDARFTIVTTVLANFQLTIQEAIITTCKNNFDLDTYIVLDQHNQAFIEPAEVELVQQALQKQLSKMNQLPLLTKRRRSRLLAHFKVKTQITYEDSQQLKQTRLFLVTGDRPGLLATVSRVFLALNITLHNAKIVTAGERAEDTFYLANAQQEPLNSQQKELLQQRLIEELSQSY
ncbi:MAG: [protein-PII] uridylyltransferase [Legionella sp.]|nr:[protein-PII] uridylyltransferase [Legionella sp.]